MMGAQCDNCRKFVPSAPAGWFVLAQVEAPTPFSGFLSSLAGSVPPRADSPSTFCSVKCVAEWAYVKAVAAESGSAQ